MCADRRNCFYQVRYEHSDQHIPAILNPGKADILLRRRFKADLQPVFFSLLDSEGEAGNQLIQRLLLSGFLRFSVVDHRIVRDDHKELSAKVFSHTHVIIQRFLQACFAGKQGQRASSALNEMLCPVLAWRDAKDIFKCAGKMQLVLIPNRTPDLGNGDARSLEQLRGLCHAVLDQVLLG